ncbi:Sec63 Brl domain-containing protein [Globomyces pollinis-pini]|nr:Sec63 Brl domain-containing protein [Globomyces pollinis-pini]
MKSNIIVTTPEKWDSITRQWDDTKNLMDHIGLLLVDEIHMLKDGIRGATLEVVISRMKSLRKLSKTNQLRIVAVSATVPNLEDFSQWLQDNNGNPATIKKFDESFRPIKLVKHVFGYPLTGNQFSFEDNLKFKLMELITRYSNSKPSLIFCSTRKSATRSAEFLVSEATQTPKNPFLDTGNRKQLELESQNIIDKKLSGYVSNGIAYHHGGLVYSDRKLVETLYIQGILKCICTTSTLAVGVNLPAHLVIIKGTSQYDFNQSKVCEYSDLDVLQMMGRAGRPQFDDHGTVVVMTTSDRRAYYENMISGTEVIESSLHLSLIEHLNAETTLGMIKNNSMAIDWLKSTFLYIRIQKNPSVYQLKNCTKQNAKLTAENRLQAIFVKDIELLRDTRLVTMNQFHGDIMSTEYGKIMARYYMKFQTISNFIFLPEGCRLRDLFECMCRAEEFNEIRFHSDKGFLNKLNKDLNIKFPIKGRVCELYQKVSLCIQATLSGLSLTDSTKNSTTHSLSSDANLILKSINRVNRGMLAIFMEKKDYISLHCALIISQALTCRMWKDSSFQLRQIEGLGPQYVKILTNSGITTFSQLLQTESTRIEMILNRSAPFGNKVLTYTKSLPKITMKCTQINTDMKTNHHYIDVKVAIKSNNVTKMMTRIKTTPIMFHLIVGTTNGQLIDCRKFKNSSRGQS